MKRNIIYNGILLVAVARLDLAVAFASETAGDAFALKSIQVVQVPNVLHPFRSPDKISAAPFPELQSTIDYAAILYDGTASSQTGWSELSEVWTYAHYMPTGDAACRGLVLGGGVNFEHQWYLPENVRGKGTAAEQWNKTALTAPDGQAAWCSYLDICGYYLHDGLVEEVVYHVYLGANNTDDYNILRNRNYKMTVNVKGKSLVDVRIDEYEPKNYIDYTDNDSPWFVAAGDFDGNQSWNQVNPKYEGWSVGFCEDEDKGAFPGKTEGYAKDNENFVRCVRDVQ